MKIFSTLTFFAAISLSLPSYSEKNLNYSLYTITGCKTPPKTPPKRLLSKSYKIYTYPGQWSIFDINGDGWCDWIRGGYEGYRLDQEEPTMKDFIYLGNSKGWEFYNSPKNAEHLDREEIRKIKEHSLFSDAGAIEFYEPIPVYKKNERKPFVVTAIRYDAPAPPPDYDRIIITRWDNKYDGLVEVPDQEKRLIWKFLMESLCNRPRDKYEKLFGPRIITLGKLCVST